MCSLNGIDTMFYKKNIKLYYIFNYFILLLNLPFASKAAWLHPLMSKVVTSAKTQFLNLSTQIQNGSYEYHRCVKDLCK